MINKVETGEGVFTTKPYLSVGYDGDDDFFYSLSPEQQNCRKLWHRLIDVFIYSRVKMYGYPDEVHNEVRSFMLPFLRALAERNIQFNAPKEYVGEHGFPATTLSCSNHPLDGRKTDIKVSFSFASGNWGYNPFPRIEVVARREAKIIDVTLESDINIRYPDDTTRGVVLLYPTVQNKENRSGIILFGLNTTEFDGAMHELALYITDNSFA